MPSKGKKNQSLPSLTNKSFEKGELAARDMWRKYWIIILISDETILHNEHLSWQLFVKS